MQIMANIKEHPYVAAGGVFVLGIVLILILFGGGKTAAVQTVTTPQSDTANATQLAMAQLNAQVQSNASNNALAASNNFNASAVQAAQIDAATTQNHDLVYSQTVLGLAQTQMNTAIGVSTINAQVANNQIAASQAVGLSGNQSAVQIAAINAQSAVQQAGYLYSEHQEDSQLQAQVALNTRIDPADHFVTPQTTIGH